MGLAPIYHHIMAIDVANSGSRNDPLQLRMRSDLRKIVADTLALQDIDFDALQHSDLGDGIRLIIPPNLSPASLLDPFVPNLAEALRQHRARAPDAARLRLRLAINAGPLHRDVGGWAGRPLVESTRILDARPVRYALVANQDVDLVLVVSQRIYDDVVCHGYVLDPAAFQLVRISEKETTTTVWIHVPGHPTQPRIEQAGRPDDWGEPAARHALADTHEPGSPAGLVNPTAVVADQHPQAAYGEPGWYLRSLRAVLRLDTATPELTEQRLISVARPDVETIMAFWGVPPSDKLGVLPDLHLETIYGARIRTSQRSINGLIRYLLGLSSTREAGQVHDYSTRAWLPVGQTIRPYYLLQPSSPCESFDLVVRFPTDATPRTVRLINGATPIATADQHLDNHPVTVNQFGELHVRFHHLHQGRAYGLQW